MSRADEQTLAHEVADLSRTISVDSDGAFLGGFPDDHLGNIAGYIGRIEALNDALRERERQLVAAIEAALAYCESEAIGTVQQEIADNERMRQTLRDALEYGR